MSLMLLCAIVSLAVFSSDSGVAEKGGVIGSRLRSQEICKKIRFRRRWGYTTACMIGHVSPGNNRQIRLKVLQKSGISCIETFTSRCRSVSTCT
jgi:hypothetical protein